MFDEILAMVKEKLENHPDVVNNLTPEQQVELHTEVANHVNNLAVNSTAPAADDNSGFGGGLLGKIESAVAGGGAGVSAIEGGIISSLTNKFGLSPAITGAIAGMIPGLLQKYAQKNNSATSN